jgi:hypothetical protein
VARVLVLWLCIVGSPAMAAGSTLPWTTRITFQIEDADAKQTLIWISGVGIRPYRGRSEHCEGGGGKGYVYQRRNSLILAR